MLDSSEFLWLQVENYKGDSKACQRMQYQLKLVLGIAYSAIHLFKHTHIYTLCIISFHILFYTCTHTHPCLTYFIETSFMPNMHALCPDNNMIISRKRCPVVEAELSHSSHHIQVKGEARWHCQPHKPEMTPLKLDR